MPRVTKERDQHLQNKAGINSAREMDCVEKKTVRGGKQWDSHYPEVKSCHI